MGSQKNGLHYAAEPPYSVNNGPIYKIKSIKNISIELYLNLKKKTKNKEDKEKNHHKRLVQINHDTLPSSNTAETDDSSRLCRRTERHPVIQNMKLRKDIAKLILVWASSIASK